MCLIPSLQRQRLRRRKKKVDERDETSSTKQKDRSISSGSGHNKDPRMLHIAGPQRYTRLRMLHKMHEIVTPHHRQKGSSSVYSERRRAASLPPVETMPDEAGVCVSRNDFSAPEPRLRTSISVQSSSSLSAAADEGYFRGAVAAALSRWISIRKGEEEHARSKQK